MSRRASLPLAGLAALLAAALACAAPSIASAQSLRGSRSSVDRMYRQARAEKLYFYETPGGVRSAAAKGRLVRLTTDSNVVVHRVGYPYVKPATRTFVRRLAAQYRSACGERLVVTSATRPATRQPANSVERSVHPTGMAIDLRKPAGACLRWLRGTLLDLERAGLLEATEEWAPPHFHVAVFLGPYGRYAAARARRTPRAPSLATATPAGAADDVYRVRAGDTLWGIARAHDTTVSQLREANGLDRATITPGQRLVIPGDTGAEAERGGGR